MVCLDWFTFVFIKMKKEKITKKAEFGNFPPPIDCSNCDGRGETKDQYVHRLFGSSNWTYKKCQHCNGTGKNIWSCLNCGEMINNSLGFWCSNKNCEAFNIQVALASKQT